MFNTSCTDCDDEPEYSTTEQSMLLLYDDALVNDIAAYADTVIVVGPGHDDDM